MSEGAAQGRRELVEPYEHPYRGVLVTTWRHQPELRLASALAAALGLVGVVGVVAGLELLGLLAGLGAMIGTVVVALWLVAMLRAGRRLTRSWRQGDRDLAAVLARRPQRGGENRDVVHDEFAVTVEDDGRLVTWRYRPLRMSEHPADFETLVPGRPRYAASPVHEAPFDVQDTVRASEQLVDAQARAAEREAAAAATASGAMGERAARVALAAEARSTAAALRRTTGQHPRDGAERP